MHAIFFTTCPCYNPPKSYINWPQWSPWQTTLEWQHPADRRFIQGNGGLSITKRNTEARLVMKTPLEARAIWILHTIMLRQRLSQLGHIFSDSETPVLVLCKAGSCIPCISNHKFLLTQGLPRCSVRWVNFIPKFLHERQNRRKSARRNVKVQIAWCEFHVMKQKKRHGSWDDCPSLLHHVSQTYSRRKMERNDDIVKSVFQSHYWVWDSIKTHLAQDARNDIPTGWETRMWCTRDTMSWELHQWKVLDKLSI